jgi:hypothetical protein
MKEAVSTTDNNMAAIGIITPDETFMFYEAKREVENLDQHIPQAVAQCLAAI